MGRATTHRALAHRRGRAAALAGGLLLSLAGALGATGAQAQAPAPRADVVEPIAGAWELTRAQTRKSCRIQLGTGRGPQGLLLGAQPTCRAAVPLMAQAVGWSVGADRTISFLDASGATIAQFKAEKEGRFAASQPERLVLAPVGDRGVAVGNALARVGMADLPPLPAEGLIGLWSIARDKGRPICSIDLTGRPLAMRGRYAAVLSGGCLDSGMKIFDPVAWYTDRGRLHLVARKGHEQAFAPGPDRVFEKNPPSGTQIYLKKQ